MKNKKMTPPQILLGRHDFKKDEKTGLGTTYEDFAETANVLVPSVRDKDGMGYDIFSLLLKERIIVVAGQVETGMASNIIAQLKYLENIDPKEPIRMLINSPGGSVTDGLAILDMMREVKCRIITVGNGMQASMGSILLAGGDERRMTQNSQLLIHQIMGGAQGGTQHSDFTISESFMAKEHEALKSVYVEFTGLNHAFWDVVGERDTWFTADQALKLGFINKVVGNEKPNGPYSAFAKRQTRSRLGQMFDEVTKQYLATTNVSEILQTVNNGSADGGIYSRLRPELLVRLAEFPEFSVEQRREELAAKKTTAVAAAANDDTKAEAPKKRKGLQPK
jgi:ATP-dependent Clp protease protease subunit